MLSSDCSDKHSGRVERNRISAEKEIAEKFYDADGQEKMKHQHSAKKTESELALFFMLCFSHEVNRA